MRPGQKKVKTFRGEHRPAEWEETAERFCLFDLISELWRRMTFQRKCETAKIRAPHCRKPHGALLGTQEDRHSAGVPHRDANALAMTDGLTASAN
ncbi:hypothetical protein [Mesorhizobium sp. Root172]|jgi:hypothetical protein|uniref:hypothetical protein n=1 Tax=Mesorhizobium sp. Root172 TaxID=1736481 RepID=UPI000A6F65DB|nr:hypothetical protein [Mesorhizobium sp. Root172]